MLVSRRRAEIAAVYLTGLAQGICLVTFPAAGNIFTSPEAHGLTSSEYGSLFLPMIVCAILASSLGGALAGRWGLKRVFVLGLASNALSMGFLALSDTSTGVHALAYGSLLVAMAALGMGFGSTLTALNAYASGFFPEKSETALTALHAILGTGTALAPILLSAFIALVAWWAQPAAVAVSFLVLILWSLSLPLEGRAAGGRPRERGMGALVRSLPFRFWGFAGIAVLYGICETVFGNWATIYLHEEKRLSQDLAALALSAFWASVTGGRLLVAAVSYWLPSRRIYVGMPALILGAFLAIPALAGPAAHVIGYSVAGLACSAFLPLTISFAERDSQGMAELASGTIVATYMLGYGLGAYGVGPLREWGGLSLSAIYAGSSVFAAGMLVLAPFLTSREKFRGAFQGG